MFRSVIYVVLFLVPVLSLTSIAQTVEPTADTYVRGSGNTDNNYSTEGNLYIKNSNGGSTDRKGYVRFEISGATAEASLDLTVTSNNQGGGGSTPQVFTVEVYGLSESLDHTWVESEITWNNAPANSTSDHNFTADATFLGSFLVDQTPIGETLTFSDPALADFISSDTDNEITLLLRRTSGNGSHNLGFASKENSNHSALTLHVRPATQAFRPKPAAEATDVPHNAVLTWTPGMYASPVNGHIVYLSDNFSDVNDGIGGITQDANSYASDSGFDFGTTYYWRVDEVNAAPDNTVFKGKVWSFEVEPYSILIPGDTIAVTASSASNEFSGPEKTLDGSGLRSDGSHSMTAEAMWFTASVDLDPWIQYDFDSVRKLDTMRVWNSNGSAEMAIGWGVKDVIIEYSVDGENWDALAEASQFSRAPGSPTYGQYDTIDFGGAAAKHVRLNIQSNWGGILMSYSLSEVQFMMIPAVARSPKPTSGSVDVGPDAIVTWRAGRGAGQHTIYMGTDQNEVAVGLAPSLTSSTHSLDLATLDLELGQTYYWRVDEVNEAESPSVWAGPVWSFSLPASLVVDDFEGYGDLSPHRPFQTWSDGFGYSADEFFPVAYNGNGTGAAIGHDIWALNSPHYDGSLMETVSTLPSSTQSMPFYYGNAGSVASKTQRVFSEPQNWAMGGAKTLSIAFRGQTGNTGTLFAMINNVKITYTRSLDSSLWHYFNIDLASVNTNLQSVTQLEIGVDGSGASGVLLIDDIRLYSDAGPADPGSSGLPLVAWVSFHGDADMPSADAAGAGFSEAPDKAYTDLLETNGYEVIRYVTTNTPDPDVLNAMDLVIISRSVASGGYQNDGATAWNSIATPMIIASGYTTRPSRMGFTTGTTMVDTTGDITLTVNAPSHPIFAGIDLANGTMVNPFASVVIYPTDGTLARGISVNNDPLNADGTLLATVETASDPAAGGMVIGEWQAGATLTHDGGAGTDTLAGHRLVLLTGAREASGISSETAGLYDLYEDGAQIFLNAVEYMLQ